MYIGFTMICCCCFFFFLCLRHFGWYKSHPKVLFGVSIDQKMLSSGTIKMKYLFQLPSVKKTIENSNKNYKVKCTS